MTLTELQRLEAVARYELGESIRQIADRFRVSYGTVRRVIPAEQLRPAGWGTDRQDVTDDMVRRLRDVEQLTWAQVGERTGMTTSGARRRYLTACRKDRTPA